MARHCLGRAIAVLRRPRKPAERRRGNIARELRGTARRIGRANYIWSICTIPRKSTIYGDT